VFSYKHPSSNLDSSITLFLLLLPTNSNTESGRARIQEALNPIWKAKEKMRKDNPKAKKYDYRIVTPTLKENVRTNESAMKPIQMNQKHQMSQKHQMNQKHQIDSKNPTIYSSFSASTRIASIFCLLTMPLSFFFVSI
jgi:hypothetical protein